MPFKHAINRVGESVLVLLLSATLVLACVQIFMRTITGGSLLWIEPLLRYLVLWGGLFGALMATTRNKHIGLDLANFILPRSSKNLVQFIVLIFATLTSTALTWAAIKFIQSEIEYGSPGLFELPGYVWNLVFPVTFGIMAAVYLIQTISEFLELLRKSGASEP